MNAPITLRHPLACHAYDVETDVNGSTVRVHANSRAQAANLARRAGHTVRSVNMVG